LPVVPAALLMARGKPKASGAATTALRAEAWTGAREREDRKPVVAAPLAFG